MYLIHWQVARPPFEAQPDSRFLFLTPAHEQALAALSYATCEGGEPALLCGPAGCGKTLLLRALRRQLPRERYHVAFVPEAACSQAGLLRRVAYHLSHTLVSDDLAAMDLLLRTADEAETSGRTIVLMLDDWPVEAEGGIWKELRWLLTMEGETRRWCVLLGGASDNARTRWPAWLAERLFAVLHVGPLSVAQTSAYLEHRLRAAGYTGEPVFSATAARLIADWSGGVPRRVNRIAHLALHVGYLDLARRIEEDAVRRAIERLEATGGAAEAEEAVPCSSGAVRGDAL